MVMVSTLLISAMAVHNQAITGGLKINLLAIPVTNFWAIPAMTESLFTITVPDKKLDLLHRKLELATFPDELENADWKYGVPLTDVKRLTEQWKNGYDWRKHEEELNDELPMFTRDVDVDGFGTLNIHYVHKKSAVTNAIPLLFCHGCQCDFCRFVFCNDPTKNHRDIDRARKLL